MGASSKSLSAERRMRIALRCFSTLSFRKLFTRPSRNGSLCPPRTKACIAARIIRRMIRAAIHAFVRGGHEDTFLDGLVKSLRNDRVEKQRNAIRILRSALRDFDEAPIYTIHGFCQHALHENA